MKYETTSTAPPDPKEIALKLDGAAMKHTRLARAIVELEAHLADLRLQRDQALADFQDLERGVPF